MNQLPSRKEQHAMWKAVRARIDRPKAPGAQIGAAGVEPVTDYPAPALIDFPMIVAPIEEQADSHLFMWWKMLRADRRTPRVMAIAEVCSAHYGVELADVLSARRTARLARARQVTMFLARQMTPKSLPEIGRILGGRDHTTVLHGARKIEAFVGDLGCDLGVLMETIRFREGLPPRSPSALAAEA